MLALLMFWLHANSIAARMVKGETQGTVELVVRRHAGMWTFEGRKTCFIQNCAVWVPSRVGGLL
jgi:hypothetical protein